MTIARETEDRRSECTHLGNLGLCYPVITPRET